MVKTSNVILLCGITFILGVLAGLFYAAFQDPMGQLDHAPGMPPQASAPAPQAPAPGMGPGQGQPAPPDPATVEARLAELDQKIAANPEDPGPYILAGRLLFDAAQFQKAVEYYEKAVKIIGENPDLLTEVGIAYRRLGKPITAVTYFTRAHKADPKHAPSAFQLGLVKLHDLSDNQGALEAWEEYLKLAPEGPRAEMIRRVLAQISGGSGGK